jgi:Ca2+-binding EF-hand superfamily protein
MGTAAAFVAFCRSGRIDREELKVLLESVEGGLAYPLMVAEVCSSDSCS